MGSELDPELTIAPASLRLKAGLYDAATVGVGELLPFFVAAYLRRWMHIRDRRVRAPFERPSDWTRAWRWYVLERNLQTEGMRRMHIRRVDARTGGRITIRSGLCLLVWNRLVGLTIRRLLGRRIEREADRLHALQPELKRIHEQHAGRKQAEQRALMELYKSQNVNPFRSCGLTLAPIVPQFALMILSPRHQTFGQLLAGVVFAVED